MRPRYDASVHRVCAELTCGPPVCVPLPIDSKTSMSLTKLLLEIWLFSRSLCCRLYPTTASSNWLEPNARLYDSVFSLRKFVVDVVPRFACPLTCAPMSVVRG